MMRSRSCRSGWITALICGCVASGCAAGYDSEHRYADGWQLARLEKIDDDLAAPRFAADDCRLSAPPAASASPQYASVWFEEGRHSRHRIVLLPAGQSFAEGDMLYVNVRDCAAPVVLASKSAT
jgi:hypothetical protein